MARLKTEEELVAYLKDHVTYEREMLKYTFQKVHNTAAGLDWNVVFESFCVHARNLYDFLRNEGNESTTFRAGDFSSGWRKSNADTDFNAIDSFLLHMSAGRIERGKITLEKLQQFGKWIDAEWAKWFSTLPTKFQACLDPSPACVPSQISCGLSSMTACTTISASTVSLIFPEAKDVEQNK